MAKLENNFFVDGTSALKMPGERTRSLSNVIPYPYSRTRANRRPSRSTQRVHSVRNIPSVLASSEMFCSIVSETAMGCPYYIVDSHDAKMAGLAISAISVIALALGC